MLRLMPMCTADAGLSIYNCIVGNLVEWLLTLMPIVVLTYTYVKSSYSPLFTLISILVITYTEV